MDKLERLAARILLEQMSSAVSHIEDVGGENHAKRLLTLGALAKALSSLPSADRSIVKVDEWAESFDDPDQQPQFKVRFAPIGFIDGVLGTIFQILATALTLAAPTYLIVQAATYLSLSIFSNYWISGILVFLASSVFFGRRAVFGLDVHERGLRLQGLSGRWMNLFWDDLQIEKLSIAKFFACQLTLRAPGPAFSVSDHLLITTGQGRSYLFPSKDLPGLLKEIDVNGGHLTGGHDKELRA